MTEALGTCPACDRPRTAGVSECPHCGVIFARYRSRRERDEASAPAPAPLPASAITALEPSRSPHLSKLSLRQLEAFLLAASESLSAGISPLGFARGAGGAMLPPALGQRLLEMVSVGGSVVPLLEEIGLPGSGDGAVLVAAEKRGELPAALRALAQGVEARRKSVTRFLGQLIYPSVLLLAWILIEPLAVLVLQGMGAYASRVLPRLLPLIAAAVVLPYLAVRLHPRSPLRRWLVIPLAYLPPFSGVILRRARAAFTDVLGSGLRAGLPLLEALTLAGGGATHPAFTRNAGRVREALLRGEALYLAIEVLPFTKEERAWIQHGEESGHLDAALGRINTRNLEQAQLHTRITFLLVAALFSVFVLARLLLGTVEAYRGYFQMLDTILEPFLGTGGSGPPRLE